MGKLNYLFVKDANIIWSHGYRRARTNFDLEISATYFKGDAIVCCLNIYCSYMKKRWCRLFFQQWNSSATSFCFFLKKNICELWHQLNPSKLHFNISMSSESESSSISFKKDDFRVYVWPLWSEIPSCRMSSVQFLVLFVIDPIASHVRT